MTRLQQLRNNIARWNQIYFNGGEPPPDAVYDEAKRELRRLSPDDPMLSAIGAPVPSGSTLEKVAHVHPMGSLNNAMNVEEFMAWHAKVEDAHEETFRGSQELRYNLSFKMDGGSVALIYENGELRQGITRGDGLEGEDIQANVVRMVGVPIYVETPIGEPFTGSVRGEVMLFNEEWKALDPDQLSNPRNLGNGISRRSDGEDCERLRFVAFRIFDAEGQALELSHTSWSDGDVGGTESGTLATAKRMGFDVVSHRSNLSASDVVQIYNGMQGAGLAYELQDMAMPEFFQTREKLPFIIDGLVVKAESLFLQDQMGEASRCPRAMIAFKFPAMTAVSEILDVEITLGHSGAIIPTAILKPVKIGGVTVSRALLCNWQEVDRLGVAVGDVVLVARMGDVIPKILSKISDGKHRRLIPKPTVCPITGGPVGHKKNVDGSDSVVLYSLQDSPATLKGKIKRWVSSLDIQGLGETYISELVDNGILTDVSDIYLLHTQGLRTGLVAVVGHPRAVSILAEIDKKRILTLSQFLGSLGIAGLGKRRVELVQTNDPGEFDTLADWTSGKLVTRASQAGLPKVATSIQVQLTENAGLIYDLLEAGVCIMLNQITAPVKAGTLTFCLTGTFDKPKAFYHDAITASGHRFESAYRKTVNYVVASDPGSDSGKLKKALKDGVPVISEVKLLSLLK